MFLPFHIDNLNSSDKNLAHLIILRYIGLFILILIIINAIFWFDIALPVFPISITLIIIFSWNTYSWWRSCHTNLISDFEFFIQLVFDVFAISGILYYSGGATNPFSWFFLLPLMISATLLPVRFVWSIAGLTILNYSLLLQFYIPLGSQNISHGSFMQHILGMWFGFILSAVLVAYFITRMAKTLRQNERILSASREQNLRDENIIALGALAAGAAHDLGTPLSTIAILAEELQIENPALDNTDLYLKLSIIASQVMRCKEAISVLSTSSGEIRAESGRLASINNYLQQLTMNWKQRHPEIDCFFNIHGGTSQQIIAEKMLDQSLCNILDNAADVSPDYVELNAQWDDNTLTIVINDHGPGLSLKVSQTIGKTPFSNKQQGLGVGLLLAHSVIERLQGVVTFSNHPSGGLSIKITLPIIKVSNRK